MRSALRLLAAALAALFPVVSSTAQVPAAAQVRPSPLTPASNAATAERIAALLEARYVFPETGRRYAAAVRANAAAGAYAGYAEPAALGEKLTADLQAVSPDRHLRVRSPRGPAPRAGAVAPTAIAVPEIAPGVLRASWLTPGVAYIAFSSFADDPAAIGFVTDFLRTHQSAKALVIDARQHHGGTFSLLGVFADHLFPTERRLVTMDIARAVVVAEGGPPFPVDGREMREVAGPAGLTRYEHWAVPATDAPALFTMPVYYLTSHSTFSAAEHMAMMLKLTGRATLIGEATGGGNHFGGVEEVGSGLEMFVPIGRTSDPATGRDWEKVGVLPDVAVPADRALDEALRRIG